MTLLCSALRALALLTAATAATLAATHPGAHAAESAPSAILPAAGDDFYGHVNGAWQAAAVIPADHTSWGVTAQMSEENYRRMAELYTAAARSGDAAARRVGLFYSAQLDQAALEARGLRPLAPRLAQIAALDSKRALAAFLGASLRNDADPLTQGLIDSENLFGLWVGPGTDDNRHYAAHLLQGGLGLPEARSYLSDDAEAQALRAQYRAHIAALLSLAAADTGTGAHNAEQEAQQILALETRIAGVHASRADSTDPAKAGQPWRRAAFPSRAPGLDWDAFFTAAGLSAQPTLSAWQPQAITGLAALVAQVPLEQWKTYLRFHAINSSARFLSQAYADQYFAFYDPLYLAPGQHFPRWIHAVNMTNTLVPGAGRLFTAHFLPPAAKARAQQMTAQLVAALGRRIAQLDWMTPATRAATRAKLAALQIGVGYPERWPDSHGLDIRAGDALGNVQRTAAFNTRQALGKLGKPVDRREWVLGAELFGINRMPLHNAITVPAFELQAPFFAASGDAAGNYGAIGAKIGRVILGMLDEKGSRYDGQGRPQPGWSAEEQARYQQAAAALVAQYGAYQPLPGITLNGRLTLAQNAANLGGLLAAYDAFHLAAPGSGTDADRRFFDSYALSLRVKDSEDALRGQALGSPLAPAPYRAAVVRNVDAWYRAYDVQAGQQLYLAPQARVRLW